MSSDKFRAVSIVIPFLNEERVIGRCLQALTRLETAAGPIEVILVDNGSTDRTVEIARSFSNALDVTVLCKPGATISAMRNYGVSQAKGEFVAFLDADCLAPPHWLTAALARLRLEELGVLGAHYKIPDDSSWVARVWFGGMALEKQGDIEWIPAGDMIMSRSTFERIRGFDESLRTNEDCELCGRIRGAGLRVVADATVAVVHLGTPQTLCGFYKKDLWHATDGLLVFLRQLPKITNPRALIFGAYTLACATGVVLGTARMFGSGNPLVPTYFLAAWLAPAFLLSVRLVVKRRRWGDLAGLTVLHLVFGVARGHACLLAIARLLRARR
ncbi:MAG: glycosyltransferase [Elusimicrobiota bacterium]